MADEKERLAGEWNEAEHGGNVDEGFDNDEHADAEGGQAGEAVGGAGGDLEGAENEQQKKENEHERTDEAELFSFDGKNGVAGRLGQIAEFLNTLAVAATGDAAGTDGDEGLLDLIAGAERIGGGIEIGHDALVGIRPDVGHNADGEQCHEDEHEQMCPAGTSRHQHAEAGDNDDDEGERVGLRQKQSTEDADENKKRQDATPECGRAVLDMRQPCGKIDDKSDFQKFGWLKRNEAQINPPPCPAGNEGQTVDK